MIGSQCEALGELSFLPAGPGPVDVGALGAERRLLVELRDLLVDGPGDCDALTELDGLSGDGLLLNPTAAQARAALETAMSAAHEAQAVLVLHLLAHGTGRQDDPADPVRHLLYVWDTVADPLDDELESRGWNPYADIKRRAPYCPRLAGLVLGVDTCRASWAKTAIDSWSGVRGGLLLAVLAASGDEPAWDACLTRTVIAALRGGVSAAAHHRGALMPELQAADLAPLAAARCAHQTPRVGGYQSHNRVLYVGRNLASDEFARRLGLDALTAGLILRLTRHYTDHALTAIADALEGERVVCVVGDAGTGKSTLAAALLRAPEDSTVPIGLVHAAAFVSAAAGVSELARSLAGQLDELPGFEQAARRFARDNQDRWDTLDVWQRELIGPLGVLRLPLRLLIDGVDQLDGTVHEIPLRRVLTELLESVERVSLVLTSRRDPQLRGARVVAMPALDDQTARRFLRARGVDDALHDHLLDIAQGRWLVLELAAGEAAARPATSLDGLYEDLIDRARARCRPVLDHVLELLAAAGTGAVLPLDVLEAALRRRAETTRAALFEILGDEDLYRCARHDQQLGGASPPWRR